MEKQHLELRKEEEKDKASAARKINCGRAFGGKTLPSSGKGQLNYVHYKISAAQLGVLQRKNKRQMPKEMLTAL